MTGTVVQINISRGGLPKSAVPTAFAGPLGLEGDGHAHPRVHGGPSKALLLVCSEAIAELIAAGFPLYNGALGENITMRGIDRRRLRSGQRYRIGGVLAQLTTLRRPCDSLTAYGEGIQNAIYDADVKRGDASSPRWAMGGFYAAVLEPGAIAPGDIITLVDEAA